MSDTGGAEIGEVDVVIGADTAAAESQVSGFFGKIQQLGQGALSNTQTGFMSFGTAASGAISNVTSRVTMLGYAMGPESPLAQMGGPLMAISTGFRDIATAEQEAEIQGRNFVAIGPALQGIGTILIGLGAAGTAFAAPLQRATAAYDTAVTNTGKSTDDYVEQLSQAEQAGKNFGYTNSDIVQALSQLTAETKNPDEAFKELTMTETLAAATHTNLGTAARQMGQIHAGMYRSLRQFGIQLPQIRNDTAKLADEEQKLADTGTKVTDSQTRLATYTEEVNQKMQADQERYTQAVQQDRETLQMAEETLAQKRTQYAEQDKARQQDLAAAVEDSTYRQATAEQKLADLKAELDANSSRSVLDRMSLSDAEARVNDAQVRVAETSGLQQQAAIQQLRDANEAYTREKLRQSDQQQTDTRNLAEAEHGAKDATDQHNKALRDQADYAGTVQQHQIDLAKAQESVARANQKLTDDQKKLADSMKPTLEQAAKLATLQEDVTKALENQAQQQSKVNDIKDQQKRLDEGFLQAEQQFMEREKGLLERRENTWAGHVAKIKAGIVDALQSFGQFAPALLTIGGIVSGIGMIARIGGAIRGIGRGGKSPAEGIAGVEGEATTVGEETVATGERAPKLVGRDAAGRFTKKGAPGDITGEGGTVGTEATEATQGAVGAVEGAEGVAGAAGTATEVAEVGGVAAEAAGGVGIFAAVLEGLGTAIAAVGAALVSVPALIVAAVIAIGIGIFELVTHWDTVSKFLSGIRHDIALFFEAIGRDVLGAAESLPGQIVEGLRDLGRFLIRAVEAAFHEVTDTLPSMSRSVLDWFAGFPPRIAFALGSLARILITKGVELLAGFYLGIQNGEQAIWDWLKKLPGRLLDAAKTAGTWLKQKGKDILDGMWAGIQDGWQTIVNWWHGFPDNFYTVIGNAAIWLVTTGQDVLTGLWNGIKNTWDDVKKWFIDLPKNTTDFLNTVAGGPIKWFEDVGKDLIKGLINGIVESGGGVLDAAKSVIVDAPKSFVKGLLGQKSPSTVYAEIGKGIMDGLGLGISNNQDAATSALAGVSENMQKITFLPGTQSRNATVLGDFRPPGGPPEGKSVTQNIEQHFHKEISPMHVAHELAWDANQ